MLGNFLPAAHLAASIEQAHQAELRDRVDQPRTADPFRRDVAADHLELDMIAQGHALDRAVGRAHAAANLAAFERRPGGGGGAEHPLDRAEHDLAVGADVDKDA